MGKGKETLFFTHGKESRRSAQERSGKDMALSQNRVAEVVVIIFCGYCIILDMFANLGYPVLSFAVKKLLGVTSGAFKRTGKETRSFVIC